MYNYSKVEVFNVAITIKEALQLPIMQKTKLVAGQQGIHHQIKWVTIVEVLEDIGRLQKGEFLITTGFNLAKDEASKEVFHRLLKSKLLSGVAIYTSFYMKEIPQSFIDLANENDLPLIEIPVDINFSEITKEVLEKIVNKQTYLLEQSEKIHRHLTTLILNDHSLTEVTKRLAQLTSSKIMIYNEFYEVIYEQEYEQHKDQLNELPKERDISNYLIQSLEKESKEKVVMDDYVCTIFPIIAKQSCFGWIVMWKHQKQFQDLDEIAIERASSVYAMEFLKKQAVEETQMRLQSNLLEDIFNKNYVNEQAVIEQALKINYDLSSTQCVFHLTFKQLNKIDINIIDRLYHLTEQLLIQKRKQHIIQSKFQSIIFLANVNGNTKKDKYNYCIQLANEILKEWQYYFPHTDLIIGIGNDYDQISNLGKSAREAQYATMLSDLVDTNVNIVHYYDLGMYDLLLEMKQSGMKLSDIYDANINGLLKDTDREIDLIETIDVYFKNNQSIQKSAEELFIHRHTLRYRLKQIEQRTGLDLKSTDDLLKLQLSVMAYKLEKLLENTEKSS